MTSERMEVQRIIAADPATIFAVLSDPHGHVAIDSSGMLMDATGDRVTAVGDRFVVHMDREALNDFPMGRYDVTVVITTFDAEREIAWTIEGQIKPPLRHIYGYTLAPVEGAPSSRRTTTGRRSTRRGGRRRSSRSSPRGRCGPPSGSWPGKWPRAGGRHRADAGAARAALSPSRRRTTFATAVQRVAPSPRFHGPGEAP